MTIWKELGVIKCEMDLELWDLSEQLSWLGIFKVNVWGQSNKEKELQGEQWK